jgi:SAM-dependent methyltransferase
VKKLIKRLLEPFARLLRSFFDPRFQSVVEGVNHLGADSGESMVRLGEGQTAIRDVLTVNSIASKKGIAELRARLEALELSLDEQAASLSQKADSWNQKTDTMDEKLSQLVQRIPEALEYPTGIADLSASQAAFLIFAESHRGFAAQARLWFNPAVTLRYAKGTVEVGSVNERILEVPYVLGETLRLPRGARILDLGCGESLVSFFLASAGHDVTGLDLNPYPLRHPNLTTIAAPFEQWEGPDELFDAAVVLSAIEHFGLGVYGEPPAEDRLDEEAMQRVLTLVKPGGILVLTAPFGRFHVEAQQRVYDRAALQRLLKGWEVEQLAVGAANADGTWSVRSGDDAPDELERLDANSVVLVTARKPT